MILSDVTRWSRSHQSLVGSFQDSWMSQSSWKYWILHLFVFVLSSVFVLLSPYLQVCTGSLLRGAERAAKKFRSPGFPRNFQRNLFYHKYHDHNKAISPPWPLSLALARRVAVWGRGDGVRVLGGQDDHGGDDGVDHGQMAYWSCSMVRTIMVEMMVVIIAWWFIIKKKLINKFTLRVENWFFPLNNESMISAGGHNQQNISTSLRKKLWIVLFAGI